MTSFLLNLAVVFLCIWVLAFALSTVDATRDQINEKFRRHITVGRQGAVATDHPLCSKIGKDALREGGHAVDAVVAAALCLGVVSQASSGIGGGAFMIVRLDNGTAKAFDMRETAPLSASENMYSGNATLKARGGLSIGVPGELAGLYEAWKHFGKLSWARLVMPSEKVARRGFRISKYLYMQMTQTESLILADEGLRQIYTSKGKLLQAGDIVYNKQLARTLRIIAKYGPKVFYDGPIAHNLVKDIKKSGGIITLEDLKSYKVKQKIPISNDILGLKLLAMPPPSGGPPMMLFLNILGLYDIPSGLSGDLGIHRQIEALKHVFAVKMSLGDPDFVNVTAVVSDMLSHKFAEELKKTIHDSRTFGPNYYGGKWNQIHDHGTSHLSVIDDERNAVSMTTTVNAYFGSGILSPSTGILLNNEMDDFSVPGNVSVGAPPPAPVNFVRPGKRPLSSMSPTIVLKDGKLKAVAGASGGMYIIAGTAEVLLNHFARGMDPLSSVVAPRVYSQLIPNVVSYENWTTVFGDHFVVPAKTRLYLEKKGHVLRGLAGGSIHQLIVRDFKSSNDHSGTLVAVSDPRKGGRPSSY